MRATPDSPALMAALIPQAVEMLANETQAEVAESLIWVITRSRAVKGRAFARIPTAVQNSATLLPICEEALQSLDFSMRLRGRRHGRSGGTRRPEIAAETAEVARYIPQLFWPEIFRRDFAPLAPPDAGELVMRKFCSIELVRLIVSVSRREAAQVLGLSATAAKTSSALASRLRGHGTDGLFATRMQKLAKRPGRECQIDYAWRRQVLRDLEAIPWNDWCAICDEGGVHPCEPGAKNRYAAVWLWEELSLSDHRLAAGLLGRPYHQRYLYTNKFLVRQLAPIEQPLRRYGERLVVHSERVKGVR